MKKLLSNTIKTTLGLSALLGSFGAFAGQLSINNANYDVDNNQLIVTGKLAPSSDDRLVSLIDLVTGAVLDTQMTSKKNFQFHFIPRASTGVPCAVSVAVGLQNDTADVKHAPVNCSPTPVTLTGLIIDDPLPNANVKVTVGGQEFTTVADQDGYYELGIVSSLLEELVLIEATADNPKKPGKTVNLVSLAGTFSKILKNPPQNVTNLTTANTILLQQANGGEAVTTKKQLETAEKSVEPGELLQLAAVIKMVIDNPDFNLPEDENGEPLFDNLIDFISDPAAVEAFIEEVVADDPENNPLVDTMNEILSDPDLIPGFDPSSIPDRYYAILAAAPGFMARGGNALEFNQDNTGKFLGQDGVTGQPIDQPFQWSVVDGSLEIDFPTPVSTVNSPYIQTTTATTEQLALFENCTSGDGQVDALVSTLSLSFTMLSDGELVDQVQENTNVLTEYYPVPYDCGDGNTGLIELADKLEALSGKTGLRDGDQLQTVPFTPDVVTGGWAIHSEFDNEDTIWNITPRSLYPEIVTFNADGSTSGHFSGESNSWSIENGDLIINYANGAMHRMRILDQLDKEFGVFHELTNGDSRRALYDLALKVNPAAQFEPGELISNPGQFWGGMVNSWQTGAPFRLPDGSLDPASWFGWRLQAEPIGDNVWSGYWDGDGDGEYDDLYWEESDISWLLLPDGRTEFLRFSDRRRWWIPIEIDVASTGERRMYVMEWEDIDGLGRRINPRINIEQEFDIIDWEYCYGCD